MDNQSDIKPTFRIMAQGEYASNDTWATGLNNNDLIVGPTGSGKTRYYVKPNLLQMAESVVVTDTKGNLVHEVGSMLRNHGYCVMHIDFTNPVAGTGYNPLDHIRTDIFTGAPNQQDILRVATALCPKSLSDEPFWEDMARHIIGCLVSYVMERLPRGRRTLKEVIRLSEELGNGKIIDSMMDDLAALDSESFAVRKWRSMRALMEADRTYACVVGFVAEALQPLSTSGTETMFTAEHRLVLEEIGRRKTALFLTVSDTDRSMDALVSLLYTQVLQSLCNYADTRCEGGALPVPVRLYLDDFATNCRIADFDKVISVIRSRNIAVSVVLQSITQLETLYPHAAAMTIVNGCDHLLYLGGQDVETARFVGLKANKTLDSILNQPVGTIWLFERGKRARTVNRYHLADHPSYCELSEAHDHECLDPILDMPAI